MVSTVTITWGDSAIPVSRLQLVIGLVYCAHMPLFAVKIALMKWLQYAIIIVVVGGTGCLGLQQVYRSGADDPQVQIVDDVARAVEGGVDPAQIIPNPSTDVAISLSPFLASFSAERIPTLSSGVMDGSSINIPTEIFAAAKETSEHRATWEPKDGVRVALVVRALKDGTFIVAGRNLREVEKRMSHTNTFAVLGISLALILTLLLELFGAWRHAQAKSHAPSTPTAPVQP